MKIFMKEVPMEKQPYFSPQIECIKLDNQISLALESTPPEGPYEFSKNDSENFNNEPFKTA